jgi:SAM-dependent methyltransferase
VLADAEYLPFKEEFDIIVSSDVIEHVLNVGSFLDCVYHALKPGGRFIVRTPYKENIMGKSAHRKSAPQELGHLRNFNKSLLKMILEDAQFKVKKIRYDGSRLGNIYRWVEKIAILKMLHASARSFIRKSRNRRGVIENDRSTDADLLQKIYKASLYPREIIIAATKLRGTIS